jgi:hypothetical protein
MSVSSLTGLYIRPHSSDLFFPPPFSLVLSCSPMPRFSFFRVPIRVFSLSLNLAVTQSVATHRITFPRAFQFLPL